MAAFFGFTVKLGIIPHYFKFVKGFLKIFQIFLKWRNLVKNRVSEKNKSKKNKKHIDVEPEILYNYKRTC